MVPEVLSHSKFLSNLYKFIFIVTPDDAELVDTYSYECEPWLYLYLPEVALVIKLEILNVGSKLKIWLFVASTVTLLISVIMLLAFNVNLIKLPLSPVTVFA